MCNTLVNSCGFKQTDDVFKACQAAIPIDGSGKGDGAIADKWNALFGAKTNFASAAGSTPASR